jgi:hypothetical protein
MTERDELGLPLRSGRKGKRAGVSELLKERKALKRNKPEDEGRALLGST